jgi:hypothetical protein
MISAGEAETAVLTEIGVDLGLVSKEKTAKVKEVLRSVTYDAGSRMLKVVRIEPPSSPASV